MRLISRFNAQSEKNVTLLHLHVSLLVVNRNGDLFWKLMQPEHRRLSAFCRKLAGGSDDGDDLCQDALLTAYTKFDQLRQRSAFRPWLYRIVINIYRNRNRRPWWQRFLPLSKDIAERTAGCDPNERYEARRLLEHAFTALSAEERALITLFELDGWTVAELSDLFGTGESATKVRLHRARRKMRARLSHYLNGSKKKVSQMKTASEAETCVAFKPGVD
jgi:RNA polymerase sigma-70 factor (ECF subfamily)